MDDIEQIKKIKEMLTRLAEDAQPTASEPAPQDQVTNQAALDRDIEDVMTTPRMPSPDDDDLSVVASDLGIADADEFVAAFNQLRSAGDNPDANNAMIAALAFKNLLSTDTSTAQRSINRLRKIYRKP